MPKLEKMRRGDAEFRILYESFGVSPTVIERAINQRHLNAPEEEPSVLAAKVLGRKKFRALTGRKSRTGI